MPPAPVPPSRASPVRRPAESCFAQIRNTSYRGHYFRQRGRGPRPDLRTTPDPLLPLSHGLVNWLGLDDRRCSPLQPLTEAIASRALDTTSTAGHSAFVTLFTVGTHSFYALPSHLRCVDGIIVVANKSSRSQDETRQPAVRSPLRASAEFEVSRTDETRDTRARRREPNIL